MAREFVSKDGNWINQMPLNWRVAKLGNFAEFFNGDRTSRYPQPSDFVEEGVPFITSFNLNGDYLDTTHCKYITEEKYNSLSGAKIDIDDIIFCLRGSIGKCSLNTHLRNGTVASSLMTIRPKTINAKFLLYCLLSNVSVQQTEVYMNGTCAANLSAESVSKYLIPVPAELEQRCIAEFLDSECSHIDSVIEQTRASIDEYKKLKQAVITQAVTKGIRPGRKMKDSGIEWIGEIPDDWEITKFKNLGRCRNGLTYAPEDQSGEEGTLVLRSSNIQEGELVFSDCVYVNKSIPDSLMVKPGDILICSRNGSAKLIGKNVLIPESLKASFGAFMMIYRCEAPRYLQYVMSSHIFNYYLGTFLTVSVNQLTGKNFDNIQFPYTKSETERAEIIEYLDKKCSEIERIIKLKQQYLTELEAYKKSLIYEYVTGKKEVQ